MRLVQLFFFDISQGSVGSHLSFFDDLLQIYKQVLSWKNCENQSTFEKEHIGTFLIQNAQVIFFVVRNILSR